MLTSRPANDELEISVFGPGVGECIVVHVGDQRWLIVDSCIDAESKRAVALEYLECIGVDVSKSVVAVVVSHWHDDHTAGVSDVIRECSEAEVFCSAGLREREFFELLGAAGQTALVAERGSGVDELSRVLEILAARRSHQSGRTVSPTWAGANTVIFRTGGSVTAPACAVEALSPSSVSITRGMLSFPKALLGDTKRRVPNPGPNELSVAIHLQFGGIAALLGADLEVGSSDRVGWRAVAKSSRNPPVHARIVKAAHHGSKNADHPEIWTQLIAADPHVVVTSFNSSRLPTPADIKRLRARTSHLSHTSPKRGPPVRFDNTTQRTLGDAKISERRSRMGHVRLRSTGAEVTTEYFGAARAL